MIYRETGQFKTNYAEDGAIFPIRQDLWGMGIILFVAFIVIPVTANDYLLSGILIPFLIFSLAALGLNVLTGYTGLVSLGSGAFMGVGCYTAWNFATRIPEIPLVINLIMAGLMTAAVGILFGIPSFRIKGFYLAVATLAAQFFIEWTFTHIEWLYNYEPTGAITFPPIVILGYEFSTPTSRYLLVLAVVVVLTLMTKNLVRTRTGRDWMAVRDMDIAAEVVGIPLLKTKLLAFGVSSFLLGVAGALWGQAYLITLEAQTFELLRSFSILFMVIIGGLGTIMGSFFGAAFIVLFPIFISLTSHAVFGDLVPQWIISTLEILIFGAMIIFFLIVEPLGLARLWQLFKERLQVWPFPPR